MPKQYNDIGNMVKRKSMQEFTTFDIVIVAITILLGLKGLFKGLIKEVFGLVGIVGGIFVASRLSDTVGGYIKPILNLENSASVSLIGFIVGLVVFWLIIYVLGMILSKVTSMSGLGIFDRILGFAFGAAKIFFIFSIIAYALYQVNSFKKTLDAQFSTSMVFPLLVKTGSYIMKLDTEKLLNNVEKSVDVVVPKDKNDTKTTTQKMEETAQEIKQSVEETAKDIVKETFSEEANKKAKEIHEKMMNPTNNDEAK